MISRFSVSFQESFMTEWPAAQMQAIQVSEHSYHEKCIQVFYNVAQIVSMAPYTVLSPKI